MTGDYAARVHGEEVPKERVDAFLRGGSATSPRGAGNCATSHNRPAAERQRRRWATQVVLIDELARRTCAKRGLPPPPEMQPPATVPEADVADLGSIIATALAHSPAARALLAALETEQRIPEEAVRDYYDRNRDRYLTPDALRRGVDPYAPAAVPTDFLPYGHTRDGIERELRQAAGRVAFFGWLDHARTGVEYAPGHEHPGDPSHQDHEHRH
ncbi:peptidyl-prolyl cis-trans isomerase [Streptomyces ferrugineus]|uniref:Peptidyl-prolyl cis-trans isomerase n=1 Tax=Streptomyces ferrugineus TaxID=1413221 RepID=A0A7M2SEV1_9ACTN|nr:peptidyl-prolyl cis-trans isomerase [Streptomyces ferrugineus]QOV34856.1 peptidyl-prolyl cis-trans isomerase [Streptomyces ferrugineus]